MFTLLATGCGKKDEGSSESSTDASTQGAESTEATEATTEEVVGDNYIELALNVYYNDGDHGYFANEAGESIKVSKDGQYTLSFDCSKDLSEEATKLGVSSLTNLTAIYILDMGSKNGEASKVYGCDIMYDKVVVDDTELTINMKEPKSAIKTSGVFDTNDPINGWDGSKVDEVSATSDHVANFTTVKNPTKISVTFTLSNMDFDGDPKKDTEQPSASANGYVNTAKFSDMDFTNMTALELTKYLGNGNNLGNTMEAYGHATLGPNASVSSYETFWSQPVTTEPMIKAMKNCGFDTLRVPVSWTNMMDYENGDYTINVAYLDRVEEIVNYALNNEMFVIVNDHWDGGWWGMFGSATPATVEKAWDMYEAIWTQVADRFKDYSDMVIFESANEELGNSLNSNTLCPDSGVLSEDECYKLTNEINQKFIDIVRNSGGNNDDRFLLIAGYNTDIDKTVDARFVMPKDTAKSKLFTSVHYYTPWNYCGSEKDARWGLKKEYEDMDSYLEKLKRFTDEGYGVIIGEYAALPVYDSDTGISTLKQNTTEFTRHFLDLCDVNNYCPVLWGRNDFVNKSTLTMISDELLELYTSRCYAEESAAGDGYLDKVKASIKADEEAAIEMWPDVETYEAGTPVAWIMWNGGAGTYSVGDVYNPADNTQGIIAHDVVVNGAGEYTVSLEFEGQNDGLTFAALAIADCELLYPNAIIKIKSITANGEELKMTAVPYTSSDDGKCTRVNLVNEWVNEMPEDARTYAATLAACKPVILDKTQLVGLKDITITFELITE